MKSKKKLNKRQTQAIVTRKRIYDFAILLMEEHGYSNVTISDITKSAGVSVGTFYLYFESKDAIYSELFGLADNYFLKEVIPNLTGKSIVKNCIQFFDYYARYIKSKGLIHVQSLYISKNKHFIDKKRFLVVAFRDLIHEGIKNGEIKIRLSDDEITNLFFVTARGLVFDWGLHNGSYNLEEKMHKYIKHIAYSLTRKNNH